MMTQIQLKVGEKYEFSDLIPKLLDFGYERVNEVEVPGQFAISGGILSLFSINLLSPHRVDFFGSEIEKIYSYNLVDGRKSDELTTLIIGSNQINLSDGSRLRPGDYVVHEDYGIGLFHNLGIKKVDGEERSYIYLEYLNGDILYVPENLIGRLSPYIGVGRRKPRLSKLGSKTWEKTYKKTYENVLLLARELLQVYAKREISARSPWQIDERWDKLVTETFPYEDTVDQAVAIRNVFDDLTKNIPMERLICGDVGFGKTEVAIRAAAQAVANGYQVAMLVPTTILVEQHFINFKNRFQNLPVTIERLSRFIESSGQKDVADGTKRGSVDILIGTHRLLGNDIEYKNLGLLIIDEEQKFGVRHKEKLKKIKAEVNVLSLSATPIPRTLFMSLSGIRDISQISTPPSGRKSVDTRIEADKIDLVKEYVVREVERGGQAYYLHNEVSTIEGAKSKLERLMPEIRFAVAHGQMDENRLASTMRNFADGKTDVLVCSTIVENGLDLPNVNTLIVEDADHFGLSQLYQIRGRIGRSPRQSYALFTYSGKKLSSNAYKRLKALADNAELGSGFNIAISDLEIRGGGNILGKEQHGNMEAVGLILYSKLLKSAVDRLRGGAMLTGTDIIAQ
ncbi:MAG: DEAD/DEAH box helicase [Patescibacteria group bacterium]|jgi:transcription-repair coupling factor (superfamily II helicase)